MSEYLISQVLKTDNESLSKVRLLLESEGLKFEKNLDYTCAVFDCNDNIIATGSILGNTFRCFAVQKDHQGEGLMNMVMTHLLVIQFDRGISHNFAYVKDSSVKYFKDLGFYPIVQVNGTFTFLENKKNGFDDFLKNIKPLDKKNALIGSVVMNANPFTKGHRYLIETASSKCDCLYVFVLKEERSVFPFSDRFELVKKGCSDLKNVFVYDTDSYMISSATFPTYFLRDEDDVVKNHSSLDAEIFIKIANHLNIKKRFVGDEPFSRTTAIYNEVLKKKLPKGNVECVIIPRLEYEGRAISASSVREAIKNEKWDEIKNILPSITLDYLSSASGKKIIEKLKTLRENKE